MSFKKKQENLVGKASDYVYNLQQIASNLILESNVSEPTSHYQFTLFIWDLFQSFCPLKITAKFALLSFWLCIKFSRNCIKFATLDITFHIKCSALILKILWPKASMIMTIKAKTLMAVLLWPKNARHPVQRVRSTCIVAMSTREHNSIDACTRKKIRFMFTFHILLKLSANGGTSYSVLKKV